jgi:hypothetical protein
MHEAIIKARKVLVEKKEDTPEMRKAIRNIQRTGNIFGDKGEEEKE